MWNRTLLTERLNIKYPIVLGPFGGGLSSTKLTSIVSNAGGLGSYGAESASGDEIKAVVAKLRSMTDKPFAINLWIPKEAVLPLSDAEYEESMLRIKYYRNDLKTTPAQRPKQFGQVFAEQLEALLAARPPVFSFVYGVPDRETLKACRNRGIRTIGTATTPDEAELLGSAGVDAIVASGFEAGGHKGSFLQPPEDCLVGTFALVPQIVDAVGAPVIAAGGIADARGLKAALALGADGVQIGTAFLACKESNARQVHRDALFRDSVRNRTVLTKAFTGRLARSLPNRLSEYLKPFEDRLPPYPIQSWMTATLRDGAPPEEAFDFGSLWAGQAAPLIRKHFAKDLFDDLVKGMTV